MILHSLQDDLNLRAESGSLALHVLPDDWHTHANGDIEHTVAVLSLPYYLTDPAGNKLTDPAGNKLIAYAPSSFNAQILHALPDQGGLHA